MIVNLFVGIISWVAIALFLFAVYLVCDVVMSIKEKEK